MEVPPASETSARSSGDPPMRIPHHLHPFIQERAAKGWAGDGIAAWLLAEHGIKVSGRSVRDHLQRTRAERTTVVQALTVEMLAPQVVGDIEILQAIQRDLVADCARLRKLAWGGVKTRSSVQRGLAGTDGSRTKAWATVNNAIRAGKLQPPTERACTDCGHVWNEADAVRHEYDHVKGYGAGHRLDVEPVCSACHHAREDARANGEGSEAEAELNVRVYSTYLDAAKRLESVTDRKLYYSGADPHDGEAAVALDDGSELLARLSRMVVEREAKQDATAVH